MKKKNIFFGHFFLSLLLFRTQTLLLDLEHGKIRVMNKGSIYAHAHDTIEKNGERVKPLLDDKLFSSMEIKYNYFYLVLIECYTP